MGLLSFFISVIVLALIARKKPKAPDNPQLRPVIYPPQYLTDKNIQVSTSENQNQFLPAAEKQVTVIEEEVTVSVEPRLAEIDYDVFRDHYGEGFADYSHMTHEEVSQELLKRKAAGEFIPSYEYRGYMNVINGSLDSAWLLIIEDMVPEECLKWFNEERANHIAFSTAVWKAVGKKVGPFHEPQLLEKLAKIGGGRIEGWVRARKNEGYFFTNLVYNKALQKRREYVENKIKKGF